MNIKENDLVEIRLKCDYGYTNTWWRVKFIDLDNTFIGELERKHWHEAAEFTKGQQTRFNLSDVSHVYEDEEQFCYGDNITICKCQGLCKEK